MIFYRFYTLGGATLPRMIILLGIFNLLQFIYYKKQKLNPRNYSEQEINMIYFIQDKGYDMNMHANIPYMNMHGCL
jgi:hypothetical protein